MNRSNVSPRASVVLATVLLGLLGTASAQLPGRLTLEPAAGVVASSVTATASGLEPGTRVALVWESANASWNVTDEGRFLGVSAEQTLTPLSEGVVGADGTVAFTFQVPEDFGYMHNVFVVAGDETVARQGFTVLPQLTVNPTSGPVGTPITVTLTGVGYTFWQLAWHLLYDSAHTGWLSAITTRGTATAVIPATGAVGPHSLQVLSGTHPVPYLNQQQAPTFNPNVPTVLAATFVITGGDAVLPGAPEAQALPRAPFLPEPAGAGPSLVLDYGSGTVGSKIGVHGEGFSAGAEVELGWTTTRGNDIISGLVDATLDLGSVTATAAGTFDTRLATPDDLGGGHTLLATVGDISASARYTITPSVAAVTPSVVAPTGDITITIKGVGWSDTANIYTLVMDNGYLGYGCGVNSQGDVTIHLKAPGQPGVHYVDLYPSIYRGVITAPGAPPAPRLEPGQDASLLPGANGTFLQLPMLNWVDHPGEELPAFRLSFEVRQ